MLQDADTGSDAESLICPIPRTEKEESQDLYFAAKAVYSLDLRFRG